MCGLLLNSREKKTFLLNIPPFIVCLCITGKSFDKRSRNFHSNGRHDTRYVFVILFVVDSLIARHLQKKTSPKTFLEKCWTTSPLLHHSIRRFCTVADENIILKFLNIVFLRLCSLYGNAFPPHTDQTEFALCQIVASVCT